MSKPQLNNSGGKKYDKGIYEIKNLEKYIGNPLDCRYRSNWEKRFCIYLDHNPSILKWGSEMEQYTIPYIGPDGNKHKYYPDFYAEISNPNSDKGMVQTLIEIKPESEFKPKWVKYENNRPKIDKDYLNKLKNAKAYESFEYQLNTYQKNLCKWDAAKKWCDNRYIRFWLVTDKDMKRMKIL